MLIILPVAVVTLAEHRFLNASFKVRFPNATEAPDPQKWRRLSLATIVSLDLLQCILGFALTLAVSLTFSWNELRIPPAGNWTDWSNDFVMYVVAMLGGLVCGWLTVQHLMFLRRYGRAPSQEDVEVLV